MKVFVLLGVISTITCSAPAIVVTPEPRLIKSEAFSLNDCAQVTQSLLAGNYRVVVRGRADHGMRAGVALKWIGGVNCRDQVESQEFTSDCTIHPTTGSFVIENPGALCLGSKFDGVIDIWSMP